LAIIGIFRRNRIGRPIRRKDLQMILPLLSVRTVSRSIP
jgi:hypothetical protein